MVCHKSVSLYNINLCLSLVLMYSTFFGHGAKIPLSPATVGTKVFAVVVVIGTFEGVEMVSSPPLLVSGDAVGSTLLSSEPGMHSNASPFT